MDAEADEDDDGAFTEEDRVCAFDPTDLASPLPQTPVGVGGGIVGSGVA